MNTVQDCVFCKIVAGHIPSFKIYEDDRALAFMDIAPINKGHILVIPKEHCYTILETPPELFGHLCSVVCRIAKAVQATVNPDGMNVMQLNGRAGNQVVPHVHVHLVPRWEGDGATICAWDPVPGKMEEIGALCNVIKEKLALDR